MSSEFESIRIFTPNTQQRFIDFMVQENIEYLRIELLASSFFQARSGLPGWVLHSDKALTLSWRQRHPGQR
jgi:hypothetical protein